MITPDPITVTDPGGRVVATMGNTETDWLQADFRAQYSATYYVSVPDATPRATYSLTVRRRP
jgi:hypothetical protein